MRLAFRTCAAHRFWLDVFEDNARARSLYRIEGFTEEGVLRECTRRDGRYRSLVLMSMLEHQFVDWPAARRES